MSGGMFPGGGGSGDLGGGMGGPGGGDGLIPGGADAAADAFPPQVLVKLSATAGIPYSDGAAEALAAADPAAWAELLGGFPPISLRRLFRSMTVAQLGEVIARARDLDPTYVPGDFFQWYRAVGAADDEAETLAAALAAHPWVDTAYVRRVGEPPSVTEDPRSLDQYYLGNADTCGVNARAVWSVAGADGAGIGFVLLDRGVALDHPDFDPPPIGLASGHNHPDFRHHGTPALGVVCSRDNGVGCVGVAPRAGASFISTLRDSSDPLGSYSVEDAVVKAAEGLDWGDVLLVEEQSASKLPVEVGGPEFDAIRLATALGIVVVEPAGNGATLLDTVGAPGARPFDKAGGAGAGYRDSGAILVAAADPDNPRYTPLRYPRMLASNYGARVDCYALGKTIGAPTVDLQGNFVYTGDPTMQWFDGTSGASAIVAGAAVALQGMAVAHHGFRLSPAQVRWRLSTTGTPGDSASGFIGTMPDLSKIAAAFGSLPDVYIRDHVGDNGDPHDAPSLQSPDILVTWGPVANPQAAFGEGSGTEDVPHITPSTVSPVTQNIYVRARNRGGVAATGVTARVYRSPLNVFAPPDQWTLLGTVAFPVVPAGNVLTVAGPIPWRASDMSVFSASCLLCILGSGDDPGPPLPVRFPTWQHFLDFVRYNNNVAQRSVVTMAPIVFPLPPEIFTPWFRIRWPIPPIPPMPSIPPLPPIPPIDPPWLDLVTVLPPRSTLELEVGPELAHALGPGPSRRSPGAASGTVRYRIPTVGRSRVGTVKGGDPVDGGARLVLRLPAEAAGRTYDLTVVQGMGARELGRLTFRVIAKARA